MPCTPPPGSGRRTQMHAIERCRPRVQPPRRTGQGVPQRVTAHADITVDKVGVVRGHPGRRGAARRHHEVAKTGREAARKCCQGFSLVDGRTRRHVLVGPQGPASLRVDATRVGEMRRRRHQHRSFRVTSGGDIALRAPNARGCRRGAASSHWPAAHPTMGSRLTARSRPWPHGTESVAERVAVVGVRHGGVRRLPVRPAGH